jgi:hypothetical protein
MWFIARSGWIFLGMIATFLTSSYGWLQLWLKTKIPKETTLLCWHNPRVFTDNYVSKRQVHWNLCIDLRGIQTPTEPKWCCTLQHIQVLDTNATIYSLVLTRSKCRKTSVVWIHTNLQYILAFWITLAGSVCSGVCKGDLTMQWGPFHPCWFPPT